MIQQNDHGFWTFFTCETKKFLFFLGLKGGSFYNSIWIIGVDFFPFLGTKNHPLPIFS